MTEARRLVSVRLVLEYRVWVEAETDAAAEAEVEALTPGEVAERGGYVGLEMGDVDVIDVEGGDD